MGCGLRFSESLHQLEFGNACANPANSLNAALPAGLAVSKPHANFANRQGQPEKLAELATPLLSPDPAGSAEISKLARLAASPEKLKKLSEDFKAVSTWWQWSPDDTKHFKSWARDNRDAAAQWVHMEAETCRERIHKLGITTVTAFILY